MATLIEQRDATATLACTMAHEILGERTQLTPDDRATAFEQLRATRHQMDVLDQQLAWENRHTGLSWPHEPAWTN